MDYSIIHLSESFNEKQIQARYKNINYYASVVLSPIFDLHPIKDSTRTTNPL